MHQPPGNCRNSALTSVGNTSYLWWLLRLRRFLARLALRLPFFDGSSPFLEFPLVACLPLLLDASEQLLGLLKLVVVLFAPLGRELAFEGMFEHRLAIDPELLTGSLQALDALVQFGKQFLDLGNDAALLLVWRERKSSIL